MGKYNNKVFFINNHHMNSNIFFKLSVWGPEKDLLLKLARVSHSLLGAGVLGDGLGSLRNGVLGQLSGQQQSHGSLDLPAGDGGPLVVVGQSRCLGSDALEDVVHERVHDGHGLAADSGVGVHLLQHLVDVDRVALLPPALLLLVSLGDVLLGLSGFLRCLSAGLGCHGGGYSLKNRRIVPEN